MKRLFAGIVALLLFLLPLSAGMAQSANSRITITYLSYTSADGSYTFTLPADWKTPTVDANDENTL